MIRTLLLCLALLLPLAAQSAWSLGQPGVALQAVSQGNGISLEQAAAQVQQQHGGRILSAETVQENGRQVHLIKVLTADHQVRTVRVPAR